MGIVNDEKINRPTDREQEFIDLYMRRIEAPVIASIMGISVKTVRVYTSRLRKKGYIPPVRHLEFKVDTHRTLTNAELKVETFVYSHEELFEVSPFVKFVDLAQVREVVKKLEFKKKDVNMLIRLYIERKQFEEAIGILYDYEQNNELALKEIDAIAKLKHRLRIEMLNNLKGSLPEYLIDSKEPFLDDER